MNTDLVLRKALTDAQQFLEELPPPPNEANTCDWVIRPLLLALGYANHEIFAQAMDASSKFPDYTILPNTGETWYLESKAWSVGLDSTHVDQAMNYAHSNGKRWVVLSNGREWRLYDDTIHGKSADRLVATAQLDDDAGMLRFLGALSKESMTANKVKDFAAERRIRDFLQREIVDPKSSVVLAISKAIRSSLPGVTITGETIVSILNAGMTRPVKLEAAKQKAESPKVVPAVSLSDPPTGDEIFCCKGPNADARGCYENGGIWVLAGSRTRKQPVASAGPWFLSTIKRLNEAGALREEGDSFVLEKDEFFSSPSAAGGFVLARPTNGWQAWKLEDGTELRFVHKHLNIE